MTYKDFKKQASSFGVASNPKGALIGGIIGAGVGGAIYPFTTRENKRWKRILKATSLLVSGAATGARIGSLAEYGLKLKSADKPAPVDQDPLVIKKLKASDILLGPVPLPGDSISTWLAKQYIDAKGKKLDHDSIANTLFTRLINRYGADPDKLDAATELTYDYADRYIDNYNNKAIYIPQK